jgi:hypothetical protein
VNRVKDNRGLSPLSDSALALFILKISLLVKGFNLTTSPSTHDTNPAGVTGDS